VRVTRACRFTGTLAVPRALRRRGALTVVARFAGNDALEALEVRRRIGR